MCALIENCTSHTVCSRVAGRAAVDGAVEQLLWVSSWYVPVLWRVAGSIAAEGACEET